MNNIDILNTSWKTEVTPEQSAEIQRLLFKHGKKWANRSEEISDTDSNFLFYCFYNGLFKGNDKEYYERNSTIKLKADDIIAALRRLEEGERKVTEETNEDGWIDIKYKIPEIGNEFELKTESGKIVKGTLFFSLPFCEESKMAVGEKITHLRQITKRPDFGKLREGDFIFYEWSNSNLKGKTAGFFDRIKDGCIDTFSDTNHEEGIIDSCSIDFVQKIYRINLETKEIEEILS